MLLSCCGNHMLLCGKSQVLRVWMCDLWALNEGYGLILRGLLSVSVNGDGARWMTGHIGLCDSLCVRDFHYFWCAVLWLWSDLIKWVMLCWGMSRMSDDVGYIPEFIAHYSGAAIKKGRSWSEPNSLGVNAFMWPFCEARMEFMCVRSLRSLVMAENYV